MLWCTVLEIKIVDGASWLMSVTVDLISPDANNER
jgi:hypothetical protein